MADIADSGATANVGCFARLFGKRAKGKVLPQDSPPEKKSSSHTTSAKPRSQPAEHRSYNSDNSAVQSAKNEKNAFEPQNGGENDAYADQINVSRVLSVMIHLSSVIFAQIPTCLGVTSMSDLTYVFHLVLSTSEPLHNPTTYLYILSIKFRCWWPRTAVRWATGTRRTSPHPAHPQVVSLPLNQARARTYPSLAKTAVGTNCLARCPVTQRRRKQSS